MKLLVTLLGALSIIVFTLSSCSSGATSPSAGSGNSTITDGVMTTAVDDNSKPTGGIKSSFPPDTAAIFCSFKLNGVAQDDMIKATWVYIGGASPDKANTVLNETYDIVQTPEASYYLAFYFDKPVEGWSKGDYKVVLSVNGKEKLSVPFKIE